MKKHAYSLLLFLLILSALVPPSFAHSGGTDGKGGHRNSSTGEYHYHHGYSAHQHTDGVCPYDYDDKTGETSGTSGSKKTETVKEEKKAKGIGSSTMLKFAKGYLVCFGALIAAPIIGEIVGAIRNVFRRKK